jgi:hypothetical protein
MLPVQSVPPEALDESQIRALNQLWQAVWPVDCFDLDAFVARFRQRNGERPERVLHIVWDGETAIAAADTFAREVHHANGPLRLMALASVCSMPARRGQGLGRLATLAAFSRVDRGEFPLSLFQTPVPDFYARLGARLVTNRFVNRRHAEDPAKNPFWDPHVMIYPAHAAWPEGVVDLNGPGY